ncbi:hypothetical protein BHE74_00020905 [Ensete ventricosum]|nr:hypothetical protein BHE74_00020905 [Ensete ventricosum]
MVDLIEFCGSCSLRRLQNPVLTPVRFKNPARTPALALGLPRPGARKARASRRCAINAESVEGEVFSVTSSSKSDVDYLGESTKGDLNVNPEHLDAFCEFSTQLLPSVLVFIQKKRKREKKKKAAFLSSLICRWPPLAAAVASSRSSSLLPATAASASPSPPTTTSHRRCPLPRSPLPPPATSVFILLCNTPLPSPASFAVSTTTGQTSTAYSQHRRLCLPCRISTLLPPIATVPVVAPPCHRCLSPPQSNPSLQPPPSSPATAVATYRQPPPSLPQQSPSPLPLFLVVAVSKPSSTATSISSAFSSRCRSRLSCTCSYRWPALFSSLAASATRCCSQLSSPLPSSSIAAGPLPLKHQQRRRYLAAPHLLGAPHDAVASSLAAAALAAVAASNRALCRCTSLLPPLSLLAAPCSSLGCRSNSCPSLPTPPLATTAAPIISNQLFDILVILTSTILLRSSPITSTT